MNIKPLSDRVVVRPSDPNEKTRGGIYIPPTTKEKSQVGEVVAVGVGKTENGIKIGMEVSVGDKVIFDRYLGSSITVDGIEYLIIHESDVMAIQS
jgi:chaperonin GroES